jgi:MFS family permease
LYLIRNTYGILFIARREIGACREENEMNELLMLLLGIAGVFAVGCSIALLALGRMIDQYPTGDESKRVRSISSPIETTKISVVLFWALFAVGIFALLQGTRFMLILGITTLFAICLFMFTALAFSFAVLSTLRGRNRGTKLPVLQLAPATPPAAAPQGEAAGAAPVVIRKRFNNPLSDFMLNALLKKE